MENEVVIKTSLRSGSFVVTFGRCMFLLFRILMTVGATLYVLEGSLGLFDIVILLAIIGNGGYLCYLIVGVMRGRVHAIISNEGIAVRERHMNIIPWANIYEAGLQIHDFGGRSRYALKVMFTDENENELK